MFVVTYTHPDEAGWRAQLMAHVAWLRDRVGDGSLRASGPFKDTSHHRALLIMAAEDRSGVEAVIASDPFAVHGLIADMTIMEWDPIFGAFNAESSMPTALS